MEPQHYWERLRLHTQARIGLPKAGGSLATQDLLAFQFAHAQAKDAVYAQLDFTLLQKQLLQFGPEVYLVKSEIQSKAEYLRRPDLGRKLHPQSSLFLNRLQSKSCQVTLVVADGLSAHAIANNALPFIQQLIVPLADKFQVGPIILAQYARVALGDEIAHVFNSEMVVVIIGERPGLSAPDSMGVYFTYKPYVGITDDKRNCISNIRPGGLPTGYAAAKLLYLIEEAFVHKLTGTALKDTFPADRLTE